MFHTIVLPFLLGTATLAGVGMIVPQVARLRRTGTADGVSAAWVGVGLIMNLWWFAYAAVSELWGLLPVSVGGMALYAVLAIQLVGLVGADVLRSVARGHLIGLVPLLGLLADGWAGAGLVVGLLYGAIFVPAVWAAYRASSVSGISPSTWSLAWLEAAIWLAYGTSTADMALMVGGLGGTVMSSLILAKLATSRLSTGSHRTPASTGLQTSDAMSVTAQSPRRWAVRLR